MRLFFTSILPLFFVVITVFWNYNSIIENAKLFFTSILLLFLVIITVFWNYNSMIENAKCLAACSPFAVLKCGPKQAICATSDPWTADVVGLDNKQLQGFE